MVPERATGVRGVATATPAGKGVGRATGGAAAVFWDAKPVFGAGFRLIFSAWRAAVAGAITGAGLVIGRFFSSTSVKRSMTAVSWSIFWVSWEAQGGSVVGEDEGEDEDEGECADADAAWAVGAGPVEGLGVEAEA